MNANSNKENIELFQFWNGECNKNPERWEKMPQWYWLETMQYHLLGLG